MHKVWFRKQTGWWYASIKEAGTYRQVKLVKAPHDKHGKKVAEAQLVQELSANRHDGGSALLRYPTRIRVIVAAVRAALPRHVPVSAKLRLGWDTPDAIDQTAAMAAEGGASWLTVHGRTRVAGYAPPAYWGPIGRVRERLGLPVVANGDLWTVADFRRCRDETGCRHFMLGRGALADPRLPQRVATELGLGPGVPDAEADQPIDWLARIRRLVEWSRRFPSHRPEATVRRLKQWLHLAAVHGSFAAFHAVKRAGTIDEVFAALGGSPDRIVAGAGPAHG